jgi:hypothetical protein
MPTKLGTVFFVLLEVVPVLFLLSVVAVLPLPVVVVVGLQAVPTLKMAMMAAV